MTCRSLWSGPCEEVADHLGTIHHEVYFTPEEALDALPDIIWHLETFEQVRWPTALASEVTFCS